MRFLYTSLVSVLMLSAALPAATASQQPVDFTKAAETAIPRVVSIRSRLSAKAARAEEQYNNPFGGPPGPNDEFWKRFFGMPSPYPQQPQERKAPVAQGSGFIISSDGLVLTNNHVVDGGEEITVTLSSGREYPAKVIGTDPNTDIALLRIDAKNLPYLSFADSDKLKLGQWVMAVGNPLGLQASVTVGVVSAVGRNDLDIAPVEEFIQTDAAINHGNSGGPLLNIDGLVVGMNTAIVSNSGGGNIGIGFAIPSNLIQHIEEELLAHGKVTRGFLGVTLQRIDSELAQAFNLTQMEGALITDVVKDGPADKAGIKPGDVILTVNSRAIHNVGTLRNSISLLQPGTKITLLIQRNDKQMELHAVVGTFPGNAELMNEVQDNIGIVVQELTSDIAKQYGYTGDQGVIVKYVDQDSPAWDAGIRPGHLIVSVNRKPVTNPDEFYRAVSNAAEASSRRRVLLQIKAGQHVRFVTLRFE